MKFISPKNSGITNIKLKNEDILNTKKNRKNLKPDIYILDNIFENLKFTKSHMEIVLICIFIFMINGYLNFIITKINLLSIKYFK